MMRNLLSPVPRCSFLASCLAAALTLASTMCHAAPSISNITPRGLQIGQATTIVVRGSNLPADLQLVLPVPITSQVVKPGATADRVELEVTLDAAVPPGIYAGRVAGASGISGPVMLAADRLPPASFSDTLSELPRSLFGSVGGGAVLKTRLAGKKGQRLVLDVQARRLGSGLRPVVRIYDSRGRQIAWSPPRATLGGDARVDTVLPADGDYSIELHDQLFRPAGPGFFRLQVGDLHYADLALPLAVTLGSKHPLEFHGGSQSASAELDATAHQVPGETAAPTAIEHFVGAAPRVLLSDHPELVEAPATDGLQSLPQVPAAISGILGKPGEEDKFLVPVTPGQKLRLEVIADRLGSPLDAVLHIRNEAGGNLKREDDQPRTSDPAADFDVPADVSKLQLAVTDLLGRGGDSFVYRLVVRDRSAPDVALTLSSDAINIAAGSTQVVPVQVTRTNYNGPIQLSLENAPGELALQGDVIPPGATLGLLTITAANVSPKSQITRLIGKALETPQPLVRVATFAEFAGSSYQPRTQSELGLAIAQPSPIGITWNATDADQLVLGGKLTAKLQLTRAESATGKIRIRLLTSQPMPKKTIKENNQDKVVDDLDRALRLEGEPVFAADQLEPSVNILVPGDLPVQPWDLVLVAELLAADDKSVVTSVAAPVRTLSPVPPFTLELAGPAEVEGKAGAGETGKLTGKIERRPGYEGAVVVTLDNVPKGYFAPKVVVPADESQFELPVTFAYGSQPGELKGVKLVGLSAPATVKSVRSNAIDVAVKVVPGEKPPAEPPKEVFEDDEGFVALLTEGGGRAIPEQREKYSGKYSLRVTPDQKFNPALPGLGVNIRENPGPGEFRYLRFAWKKTGGNSICLQLNHDGQWGPPAAGSDSGREGAKFRYHAGPGGECYGASVVIDEKLPRRFTVVTRDLFADFGEFTLTGLAFSPVDGNAALFDHIYLARQPDDFELIEVEKADEK